MSSPEVPQSPPQESEVNVRKLETFIEILAAESRSQGIPIKEDGRIDMLPYKNIYPDVESDLRHTREGRSDAKALHEKQLWSDGEKLEMLAYAIFHKNLGPDFVVARSAPHDDRVNRADTIIFEKATGNLVCAFDEVGATSGTRYEEKQIAVRDRNLSGRCDPQIWSSPGRKGGCKENRPWWRQQYPAFLCSFTER